ncbi:MATE family efflux transporter [Arthrobacter sp. zg-Y826]|uniref:murein biosynthesis integral membrane protein MurJ n=1 Tax=Arthrobacter jinronghuae TaxID=2964609 RepID=UPI002102AF84|nr:lipid II flippase MurJ [Arthrobacter jinronghuae]MCQ1957839.1 MATE family efflux transporter [Arthrobacter jinronghuae]
MSSAAAARNAENAAPGAPSAPGRVSAARASTVMAAGTVVSRVLGLVRTALLATAIGASAGVSDLFSYANALPNFIYLMLAGGVFNAVLVPQIVRASRQPDRGADYVSRILTLAVAALLVLTVLVTLAAPVIIQAATRFTDSNLALATAFAYWCLPQIFFYGLYAVLGQILNANGSFGPYMWAPVVNNLVSIGALVVFLSLMGAEQAEGYKPETWTPEHTVLLAGGMTLGVALQALLLFLPLRRLKLGLKPTFGLRGTGLGRTGRLASVTIITMALGNGLYFVNLYVATIASDARQALIEQGRPARIAGLTNLDIGAMVYQLPHAVIALSLATVMFNQLSAAYAGGNLPEVRAVLSQGLRLTGVATVFGAAALLAFAGPLGMLFSESPGAAALNGIIIAILAVGAPFLSANFLLGRVFYAGEDVKTPLKIQLILSGVGVVLAVIAGMLDPRFIVPTLAVAYSLGNVIAVVVSHVFLTRAIGPYGAGHIFDAHVRFAVAGIVAALAGTAVSWAFGGYDAGGYLWQSKFHAVVVLAVGGVVMGAVYLGMLKLLRVAELGQLAGSLQALVRRGRS